MEITDADEVDGAPEAPGQGGIVRVRYTVEPNYAGWRLDKYLCQKLRRLSRTRIQEIIANDLIFERRLKPSTVVWPGLTFSLKRRERAEPSVPGAEALTPLYEDDALLVLNKPAGLPIHPTARYHHGTLVEQLKLKYGSGYWAAPAHRLDRETSGLVLCGRTQETCRRLMQSFMRGEVRKQYLAIVEGCPQDDCFEVDAPIALGTDLIRVAVRIDPRQGRPALTRFEVERRFRREAADFALLRCFPKTGRQHQIRIHAQWVGHPLVGDKMYGPDPGYFDRFTRSALEPEAWARLRLPRQALHAARLDLPHPTHRQQICFEAPLAADLLEFLS